MKKDEKWDEYVRLGHNDMMRIGLYRKEIYDRKRGMCYYDALSL